VEFTVDEKSDINYFKTNTTNKILDTDLRKAFLEFEEQLSSYQKLDPIHKYNLVIIQKINNQPVIKCNKKAIAYIPPVFGNCGVLNNYGDLNQCNYVFISNFICNHADLSQINIINIKERHKVYPTLIIDHNGKVVAAKVESKNKLFLESY